MKNSLNLLYKSGPPIRINENFYFHFSLLVFEDLHYLHKIFMRYRKKVWKQKFMLIYFDKKLEILGGITINIFPWAFYCPICYDSRQLWNFKLLRIWVM